MRKLILFSLSIIYFSVQSQNSTTVNWISFEEAVKKNETNPKKFLIDVYTDWCGWCKKLDATTFKNQTIAAYINEYFWAVKLDAEYPDTIKLGSQIFVNENPNARRSAHQLAIALLNGKMTYPSIVYLDENLELLQAIPGYYDASGIEPILTFFGDDIYKRQSFDDFKTVFSSNMK